MLSSFNGQGMEPVLTNTLSPSDTLVHEIRMSELKQGGGELPHPLLFSKQRGEAMPADHKHCTCKSIRSRCDLFSAAVRKWSCFGEFTAFRTVIGSQCSVLSSIN